MTNFLKKRKSIREFKNKKINGDLLGEIKTYIGEVTKEEENIRFKLYDGEKLQKDLKGIGGYSGVMIESPYYIALDIIEATDRDIIYGAYYMEKIITTLNSMGLDTCWVSIEDVNKEFKREILGEGIGSIDYLLAIGYGRARNPFVNESFSDRIGVEDIVFVDKIGNNTSLEELENRGIEDIFYYVRFAPSAFNRQPWRFLLEEHKVSLLLKHNREEEPNLIDAGISIYYFESLGSSIGLNIEWKLRDGLAEEGKDLYRYIAEFKL